MYYVVLEVESGDEVGWYSNALTAAAAWVPGTVHGKGRSRIEALMAAERARQVQLEQRRKDGAR